MEIKEIEYLAQLEDLDPDNGNLDVFLTLVDGRTFLIVVSTPVNIYWCMENEGVDYFFGSPEVFVKKLTRENIRAALEAIVTEDDGEWLYVYGTLQEKSVSTDES
jgi:hypothetical protein